MQIKISPNDKGNPAGKVCDVELHFPALAPETRAYLHTVTAITYGPQQHEAKATQDAIRLALALDGLKLVGFAVWERRTGSGRNVTFPARAFSVNGERRSFALLRPFAESSASDQLRDLILAAVDEHERQEEQQDEGIAAARQNERLWA